MLQKTSTTTRLIELVVKILGGNEATRAALRCSQAEFEAWTSGMAEPPWNVFEQMVDLVIRYRSEQIQGPREAIQNPRSSLQPKD